MRRCEKILRDDIFSRHSCRRVVQTMVIFFRQKIDPFPFENFKQYIAIDKQLSCKHKWEMPQKQLNCVEVLNIV